jgi:peptide/nickel transport system permease protein
MTTLAPQRFKVAVPRNLAVPTLHPLARVVVRRLLLAIPLLFVVSALSFVLVSLTPGDVARQILGQDAPQSAVLSLRHQLGIDQPIYQQYWHWLSHAVSGDFGTSVFTGQAVSKAINDRLSATLWLILWSLLVVGILGVGLGVLSAVRGGVVARVVDAFALIGFALPSFWIGAVLISLLAVHNHWFPAVGYVSPSDSPSRWLQSLALPVVALSLHSVAALAKQTREAMVDVLASEHIRMARANGVSTRSLLFRHALKNAAIRIVTVFGLLTVGLLGGTVIVESVFALPGTGSLAVTAVTQHDLPVVQGIVIYYTLIVVVVNLLVDLAYTWLNPRVRTR